MVSCLIIVASRTHSVLFRVQGYLMADLTDIYLTALLFFPPTFYSLHHFHKFWYWTICQINWWFTAMVPFGVPISAARGL